MRRSFSCRPTCRRASGAAACDAHGRRLQGPGGRGGNGACVGMVAFGCRQPWGHGWDLGGCRATMHGFRWGSRLTTKGEGCSRRPGIWPVRSMPLMHANLSYTARRSGHREALQCGARSGHCKLLGRAAISIIRVGLEAQPFSVTVLICNVALCCALLRSSRCTRHKVKLVTTVQEPTSTKIVHCLEELPPATRPPSCSVCRPCVIRRRTGGSLPRCSVHAVAVERRWVRRMDVDQTLGPPYLCAAAARQAARWRRRFHNHGKLVCAARCCRTCCPCHVPFPPPGVGQRTN